MYQTICIQYYIILKGRFMKFSATITVQYDTPFSPFPATQWEEAIIWAKKSRLDGVEVCISHYRDLDVKNLRNTLDTYSLGCSTISTGQARCMENISLLHDEKHAYEAAQERLKQHIDAASILDSAVTLGLLRGLGEAGNEKQQKRTLAERMDPIVNYAEKKGITIILEPINRYETALLNSAEDTLDFITTYLGNPSNVKVLWDVFHANIEDPSFDKAIEILQGKLHHVHLADSNRMVPGYGHINFEHIIQKLSKSDFQSYISFECLNLPSIDIVRSHIGPFVENLRSIAHR